MPKLPQRPRSHVLGDEAVDFTRQVLPKEWVIEERKRDYGRDLIVEIVLAEQVTGADFSIQVKGTDHIRIRKKTYIAHPCETSTLRYFLQRPELVIYLLYDAKGEQGYWIWIQDYIRSELMKEIQQQDSATIRIPLKNVFDKRVIDMIQQRVIGVHNTAKWLTAVQTSSNPYFRYNMETTSDGVMVKISSRYPGAEHDRPVTLDGTFKFDNSPEAQEVAHRLDQALRTGAPVKIDSRFYEGFGIPEAFSDLFAHIGEFRPSTIEILPVEVGVAFPVRITIMDANRRKLAELPYIELTNVQSGTDEFTLSNAKQDVGVTFKIRCEVQTHVSHVSVDFNPVNRSVAQVRDILHFQRAVAIGHSMILTNINTGISTGSQYQKNTVIEPDTELIRIVDDLAFIQEATNQLIIWHGYIDPTDAQVAKTVVEILRTGMSLEKPTGASFSMDKSGVRIIADALQHAEHLQFRLELAGRQVRLLDTDIDLGPVQILAPKLKPTSKTVRRLRNLDRLSEDAVIKVEFNVLEPGVVHYYLLWLPVGQVKE